MIAQDYTPSTDSVKPETAISASIIIATIVLSMLALIGILSTLVVFVVKLSNRFPQSNEKQPLLDDRYADSD